MSITPETVEHVARLARLELTPPEIQRYTQDLGNILALVAQLDALELPANAATPEAAEPVVFRPDQSIREFSREALLANAPHEEDGCFRVPRILGGGDAVG